MAIELAVNKADFDSLTEIELEGTTYKYRLYWHQLYDRWLLDLQDIKGVPLLTGKKLTLSSPTFRHRKLPGEFMVVSKSLDDSPASLTDLGERIALIYYTKAELNKGIFLREEYTHSDFIKLLT